MCVCARVRARAVSIFRLEVGVSCLSQLLSILFFETKSVLDFGVHHFG